jgi:hypothetical protein
MVCIKPRQIEHRVRADLCVDAGRKAGFARPPQCVDSMGKRSRHIAHTIVERGQPVERDAKAVQSGIDGFLQAIGVQIAAAGLNRAVHSMRSDRANDLGPVPAQVRFPANQRDLPCT